MLILNIVNLILGLILLWWAGHKSVIYSVKTSKAFGVDTLFIGFALIAVTTGLPELLVTFSSLLFDEPNLSAGTIIGSNFVDVSLVLGLPGLFFGPIHFAQKEQSKNIFIFFLTFFLMSLLFFIKHINKTIGIILIGIYVFGTYIMYRFSKIKATETNLSSFNQTNTQNSTKLVLLLIWFILLVVIASHVTVKSLVNLVAYTGLAPEIIGATILSVGTSLPELTLSWNALRKKEYSLAIGNSFGSIFEQGTFILGILSLGASRPINLTGLLPISPFFLTAYIIVAYSLLFNKKITKLASFSLVLVTIVYYFYTYL